MSNMSYCRFHNTYYDFSDCTDTLEAIAEDTEDWNDLSEEEQKYARNLYKEAQRYIEFYEAIKK